MVAVAECAGHDSGDALTAARKRDADYRLARRAVLIHSLRSHDQVVMPMLHGVCTIAVSYALGSRLAALTTGPRNAFFPEDPSQRMANPWGWLASIFGGLVVILVVLTFANLLLEELGRRRRQRHCDELGEPKVSPESRLSQG